MSARSFLDTNLLVYSDDDDSPEKKQRALEILATARREGTGVLSTQVLQEYFSTATRKLGVAAEVAREKVEIFARFDLVPLDLADILTAIDLHRLHSLSFWDALIVSAARRAGCSRLLTEDLQPGWKVDGLTVENPFAGL